MPLLLIQSLMIPKVWCPQTSVVYYLLKANAACRSTGCEWMTARRGTTAAVSASVTTDLSGAR